MQCDVYIVISVTNGFAYTINTVHLSILVYYC
jgi:hypothetical protein